MNAIFVQLLVSREKWTLFDESTRVPLLISHPNSPVLGKHYPHPVELVDIFPTLTSLLHLPAPSRANCLNIADGINTCLPLEGKSLLPILVGTYYRAMDNVWLGPPDDSSLGLHGVALSQAWRCAGKKDVKSSLSLNSKQARNPWFDCNVDTNRNAMKSEISVMGYSFRSLDFRYTMWIPVSRVFRGGELVVVPSLQSGPLYEELYDHRGGLPGNYTNLELTNLACSSTICATEDDEANSNKSILNHFRGKYLQILKRIVKSKDL